MLRKDEKDIEKMKKEIQEVIDKYTKVDNEKQSEAEKQHAAWVANSYFHQNKAKITNTVSQEELERLEVQDEIDEKQSQELSRWFS